MKILFTSVGRRVELMQAFHCAAEKTNTKLSIYGADVSVNAPALAFCDKSLNVYRINDPDYIPSLLKICKSEKIDALIRTIDTDLLILSEKKGLFDEIGTKVFISDYEMIKICRNKNLTHDFFVSCGLRSPETVNDYRDYQNGFPAFIKPQNGSSSIDAYVIDCKESLAATAKKINDYIVQPYISGTEYTVDIFCDFDGNPIYITPRERIAVRAGEVLKTRICQDTKIKEECKKIIERFKPVGQITVQLIRDIKSNEDYFIEINPRFGGGAPLSIKAGADSAEAVIRLLNGEELIYIDNAAEDNAVYSRYDQSIRVNETEAFK